MMWSSRSSTSRPCWARPARTKTSNCSGSRMGHSLSGIACATTQSRNWMRDHVFDSAMPRIALAALITALVLLALAVSMTATDAATKQPPKSIVLGRTINTPDSGCPNSGRCQVVARVTGIQMQADGTQELFRAPSDGRVVAWWLRLPALTKAQIKSFSDLFGGGPSAQIAVLRRGTLGRARLGGESPVQARAA